MPSERSSPHTTSASDWPDTTFTTTAPSAPTPGSLLTGSRSSGLDDDRPAGGRLSSGDGEARRLCGAVRSRSAARGRVGGDRRGGRYDHRDAAGHHDGGGDDDGSRNDRCDDRGADDDGRPHDRHHHTSSSSASSTPTWVWVLLGILAAGIIGLLVALFTGN